MNLFALGLNHNTAPLALREKVAFSSEELDTANQKIRAMLGNSAGGGIKEVAILSTCNRSEIYYFFDDEQQIKKIQNIYCDMFDKAEIEQYIRHCEEDKAVSYLFQVTAGLESMVLGEDQILGQVKVLNQAMRNKDKDNAMISKGYQTLLRMLDVVGFVHEVKVLSDEDIELYQHWQSEKAAKNFEVADQLREKLQAKGII